MKKLAVVAVLSVFIFSFSGLYGQTNIGFNGIGGFVGFAMPEDPIESTLALGAKADLGTIFTPDLAFEADLAFWTKGYESTYYEWSYTQIYVSALGKYSFASGSDFQPYAGGGLGFVHQSAKAEYTGPSYPYMSLAKTADVMSTESSDSEIDLCIHILGGFNYQLSDMLKGFAEARYSLGGADTFFILAGVMYSLQK